VKTSKTAWKNAVWPVQLTWIVYILLKKLAAYLLLAHIRLLIIMSQEKQVLLAA
jgi:hypothetical protein